MVVGALSPARPAPTTSSTRRFTSTRWEPLARGRCRAKPRSRAAAGRGGEHAGRVPQLAGRQPVPQHAGDELEHVAGVRVTVEQVAQVGQAGDRVDDAPAEPLGHFERGSEGPPRREHEQVAREPAGHLGQLGVGADRDGVGTQPGALAGQPPDGEAIAVALDHRHQTGGGVGDGAQVPSPGFAVDGEGQAHRRLMASWNAW